MSERKKPGELVLHPHVSGKLQEIEALRKKLGVLIEEHESLLYGEREVLLAKYNRDVGHLEHELFLLKVEIGELRRRIAILQADVNLGETITAERVARLDEEIQKEFETARAEIEERGTRVAPVRFPARPRAIDEAGGRTRTEDFVPSALSAVPSGRRREASGTLGADMVRVAARLSRRGTSIF